MREFHVFLIPRPVVGVAIVPVEVDGCRLETLSVTSPSMASFPVTFEETEAALSALPRMFCEPDGSFVWRSSSPQELWQLDGLLADVAGSLVHVELKGACSPEALDQLLATVGWPQADVAFQLARTGVLVDEEQFRMFVFSR